MILYNLNQLFHLLIQSYIFLSIKVIQSFKSKVCDCCSDKSCLLNSCLLEASTCRWSEDHYHLLQINKMGILHLLHKKNISPFTWLNEYLSMVNFDLDSLPPFILHKILSKVATTSIRDFGCARVAFPGFHAVGREDYFYKSAVSFSWMTG